MSAHWQAVYANKAETQTSWFRPHLDVSLELIDGLKLAPLAPIIDVGGGRSTLAEDLQGLGYRDLTVLDIAGEALAQSRSRLGSAAGRVHWIEGDVLDVALPHDHYALWHDRAVFHFFTEPADQERYLGRMHQALRAGGHAIVATFAADGPERCSNLPVCRYDADALAARFADRFEAIASRRELHRTPFDTVQPFTYLLLRRRDAASDHPRTPPAGANP